jgi:hypothetical protein
MPWISLFPTVKAAALYLVPIQSYSKIIHPPSFLKWAVVYELNEDDFDRRIEYCETFLSLLENEPDLIHRIMWSDEVVFKLNGHMNLHNFVYWASQNPNVTWEHTMQVEGRGVSHILSALTHSISLSFSSIPDILDM